MREKAIKGRHATFALTLALAMWLAALLATPAFAEPVAGDKAMSWGAGNVLTGDSLSFKNKKKGAFVAMRADAGDFEVQTQRKALKRGSKKIYDVAVGVKANAEGDRLVYTAKTNVLELNGEPLPLADGEPPTAIAGGGTVEKSGTSYFVTSEAGDKVTIVDVKKWVNVEIQAGPNRQGGELKGSLGQFDSDADPTNDPVFPEDQAQAAVSNGFLRYLNEVLNSWKLLLSNSFFA